MLMNSHNTLMLVENGLPPHYSPSQGWKGQSWKEVLPVHSVMSSTNGHWLTMREKKVLIYGYRGPPGQAGMAWLLCQGV